ncbi:M20/M25/M40 family metallo-hydrolase [Bacteroidota bacterium]
MKKKHLFAFLIMFVLLPVFVLAQTEPVDLEMIYKIKQYEKSRSQIEDITFWMTDYLGPRLTASQNKARADKFVKNKFEEFGLSNAVIDPVRPFDRGGWDNRKTYVAMTAPYYSAFAATPVAWTGSTKGLIKGEVVLLNFRSLEDLEQYKGKLKGKIVLMPATDSYEPSFEPMASRYTDEELEEIASESMAGRRRSSNIDYAAWRKARELRTATAELFVDEGVALIVSSSGEFNVPRSNGARYQAGDKEPVPEINLAVEAHGRMQRLIQHDVPVEMEVEIKNVFSKSENVTNVMAEIPGTDPELKDEVVLIGAHLDSWHGGTGAADNASGCIVMMEAMRILRETGIQPRRTIRIALWGGEEQGFYGSKGYVEKYIRDPETLDLKPGFDQFDVYFNMDNGSGRYRGIYLQQNEMVRPIFEAWLTPFENLGCNTIAIRNTRGTDHLSFDPLGLPAFQFIQDEIEYDRGYHTLMDTYERLVMDDLKQNAMITAALVYFAAQRDEKLPRKPYEKPDRTAGE